MSQPSPATIARTFARYLFDDFDDLRTFREMRRRNAAEVNPRVCHSHDFCDANMTMEAALVGHGVTVFGADGHMTESACALWNAAWEVAMTRHLTAKRVTH